MNSVFFLLLLSLLSCKDATEFAFCWPSTAEHAAKA